MKDKLQEYALIAEIISAFAVVASLIFVGLEIRQSSEETLQNTRALEINAYQDLISQISSMNKLVIEDPTFAELYDRVIQGEIPQNGTEKRRIDAYFILSARHGDMAYRQYRAGLIDQASLNSALTPTIVFLREMIPAQERWEILRLDLDPDYVAYLEGLR